MKKLLFEVIAMVVVIGSYGISLHAQTPAKPATSTSVPVPASQRDAIVTAQRDYALAVAQEQQLEQQEAARQQKAIKDIQAIGEKINAAVAQARTAMKIGPDVPFDSTTVSFTVTKK